MEGHGSTHRNGTLRNESVARMPSPSTTRSGIGIGKFRPTCKTSCACPWKWDGIRTPPRRGSRWMNSDPLSRTASATSCFDGMGGAAEAMAAGVVPRPGLRTLQPAFKPRAISRWTAYPREVRVLPEEIFEHAYQAGFPGVLRNSRRGGVGARHRLHRRGL